MVLPLVNDSRAKKSDNTSTNLALVPGVKFESFIKTVQRLNACQRYADKCSLIADYFSNLQPEDLSISAKLLSGKFAPDRPQDNVSSIQESVILSLSACTGVTVGFAKERYAEIGRVGLLANELFNAGLTISNSTPISLLELWSFLVQAASLRSSRRRSELITSYLRRCSPAAAQYVVEVLCAELEQPAQEGLVKAALSQWLNLSLSRVQSVNLLVGDIGETAITCLSGNLDDFGVQLFHAAHLASPVDIIALQDVARIMPKPFYVEDQFGGMRVQVHIGIDGIVCNAAIGQTFEGIRVAILSEGHQDLTQCFPELIPFFAALVPEIAGTVAETGIIFDGEIISLLVDRSKLPSADLSPRINERNATPSLIDSRPVGFVAIDQIYGEGRILTHDTWLDRRSMLCKTQFDSERTFSSSVRKLESFTEIEDALLDAHTRGYPGIVLKNPRSRYCGGQRTTDWLKISHLLPVTK